MKRIVLFASAAGALFSVPQGAGAQVSWEQNYPGVVCMQRAQADGEVLKVVLPDTYQASLSDKGFEIVPCSSAFVAESRVKAFRDTVCDLAAIANQEVQSDYEAKLGERPAVLCAFAEAAMGRWQRYEERNQ